MIGASWLLVARLPRTVRLLVLGTLVNRIGSFIVPYLSLVLRREFRLPEAAAGALLAAYGIGSLVSVLAGGVLTDRLGRRATTLLSLGGSGALAMAMAAAPSLPVFLGLLLAFGFLADLYRPASSAIITDSLPSADRAVGFAAVRMAVNLGFAVGLAAGGFLADWSWRLLFLGDGLTTLLFAGIVLFLVPETRPIASVGDGSSPPGRSPLRDDVFAQALFTSVAYGLVLFTFFTVLPLTVTGAGYPARTYGALLGVNGVLIGLFEVAIADRLRRFRRLRVAALGLLLTGAGFALTPVILHWAWILFTVLVWTAGEILTSPQHGAFVADWAPPAARGRYLSLYQATWSVALALNPILFLPLHARLGEGLFWPAVSTLCVPAAWVLLRLDRSADRPERLAGAG
jgi:MFS family permease